MFGVLHLLFGGLISFASKQIVAQMKNGALSLCEAEYSAAVVSAGHHSLHEPRRTAARGLLPQAALIGTKQNTHRGARTHDHKAKSLALCRLS